MAGSPWTNQAVTLILLTSQTTGFAGLFGYAPSIGAGNLIFSLTAKGGTDPYGNTYSVGLTIRSPVTGVFDGINLNSGSSAENLNAYLATECPSSLPGQIVTELSGPSVNTYTERVTMDLYSAMSDGSVASQGNFSSWNDSGVQSTMAAWDAYGFHVYQTLNVASVSSVPATPSGECVLYYKGGALYAMGPSGNPVHLATT